MMVPSLVSVIIPNYNHARYLDERIQSVLNQTFQEFEVIILDDKSTDQSLEVIEKYRCHPKVTNIIANEENSGSSFVQWRKGMDVARGELIWIAESDDSCEPTFLEKLVAPFLQDSEVVLSYCRSQSIDETGNRGRVLHGTYGKSIYTSEEFFHKYLNWMNVVMNASSAVFRRDVALNIEKGYMDFKGVGDWLFWIEIAERGKIAVENEPLNFFRSHSSNTTERTRRQGINGIEFKRIFEYLQDHGHLSWIDAIRLKKKRIYAAKYVNDYYDSEEIRQKVIDAWHPNWLIRSLAYISYLRHRGNGKN